MMKKKLEKLENCKLFVNDGIKMVRRQFSTTFIWKLRSCIEE